MNVVAILNPVNLVGRELRDGLDRRQDLWRSLKLMTSDPVSAGTVTEVAGSAALVQAYEEGDLDDVDLLLSCGPEPPAKHILSALPASATVIALAPAKAPPGSVPVVAGVNLERAQRGRVLVSPAPAVVVLAHLLHPLRRFRPREVVAHLVQPASVREEAGIDELLEQTRSILAFSDDKPKEVFGHQLAFNLLPTASPTGEIVAQLQNVMQVEQSIALHIVQGGVFHCLAAGVYLRLESDPGVESVERALAEHPLIDRVEQAAVLGPIEAAARDEVLLGSVTPAPGRPGGYWLWAVMDNLTRGGAVNALEIAEAVLSVQA